MAHHDEAGDPSAALDKLDEALSTAVEQLEIYLNLNHPSDERSAPADFLAAVLHRYAQRQHSQGDLPLASLAEIINEVREAREDSNQRRAEYHEEYGERAGGLLASMRDAAGPIPPRLYDRGDIDLAVDRYRARLDHHLGEGAGLPAKQKTLKNADALQKYDAAIQECIMLYWKNPERYVVNPNTAEIDRESVFDYVAPKYGLNSKTLFNRYNDKLSSELKARLARRAREKRRHL
ncbi:hypothetical protein [Halomonas sp. E14]|uniref:hypothetical protein n=1 Tax=Halomonas sp. E14 TaxID=3397245 RepID=UPI00403EC507